MECLLRFQFCVMIADGKGVAGARHAKIRTYAVAPATGSTSHPHNRLRVAELGWPRCANARNASSYEKNRPPRICINLYRSIDRALYGNGFFGRVLGVFENGSGGGTKKPSATNRTESLSRQLQPLHGKAGLAPEPVASSS